MRSFSNTATLEEVATAAIEAARTLKEVFDEVALDLGNDAARVRAMFAALEGGRLYRETEEPALQALRSRVLASLSDRVPGYRSIALTRDTSDFWFLDEELEGLRVLWEQLRTFRRLRQKVLDEVEAERQLAALRRRPVAYATE